jgi:hypothetical protein
VGSRGGGHAVGIDELDAGRKVWGGREETTEMSTGSLGGGRGD